MIKLETEETLFIDTKNKYKKVSNREDAHSFRIKTNSEKTFYRLKECSSTDSFINGNIKHNHVKEYFEGDSETENREDVLYNLGKLILSKASAKKNISLGDETVSERWIMNCIYDGLKWSEVAKEVYDKYGIEDNSETSSTHNVRKKCEFVCKQLFRRLISDESFKEEVIKICSFSVIKRVIKKTFKKKDADDLLKEFVRY